MLLLSVYIGHVLPRMHVGIIEASLFGNMKHWNCRLRHCGLSEILDLSSCTAQGWPPWASCLSVLVSSKTRISLCLSTMQPLQCFRYLRSTACMIYSPVIVFQRPSWLQGLQECACDVPLVLFVVYSCTGVVAQLTRILSGCRWQPQLTRRM